MKKIPLSQGLFAIVDDRDFEALSLHKWFAHKSRSTWYACRNIRLSDGKRGIIKMHREILSLTESDIHCDHKDGNGLNNCRSNLRACTHAENRRNVGMRIGNKFGFKGVSHHKKTNKFQAQIEVDNRNKYLGVYSTPIDAARAYDEAAKKYHGEFARLNFPEHQNA